MTREHAYKLRDMLHKISATMDDADALEAVEFFPSWSGEGIAYEKGQRRRYDGDLYRCEQSHVSQPDWKPSETPALWTKIAEPGEIPVWVQPTGAQDAYMMYDKVYYPNKGDTIYISDVDNNVWQPGVYGWSVYHEA